MLAAAAMSLSSFCVVINALRLNIINIDKSVVNKKRKELDMSLFRKEKSRIFTAFNYSDYSLLTSIATIKE